MSKTTTTDGFIVAVILRNVTYYVNKARFIDRKAQEVVIETISENGVPHVFESRLDAQMVKDTAQRLMPDATVPMIAVTVKTTQTVDIRFADLQEAAMFDITQWNDVGG